MLSAFPSAIEALRANVGRGLLTALGIIIGVAAVIAIVALGEGASAQVNSQLAGLGVNVLIIEPGSTRNGGVSSGAGSSNTLKASDADAIAAISGVTAISPVVSGNAQVIAGSQNWLRVSRPSCPPISPSTPGRSTRAPNSRSTTTRSRQTWPSSVRPCMPTCFPNGESPVGQSIQIRDVLFTVIGLLTSKGTGAGGNQDDVVMIPFNAGQVRLFGASSVNQIVPTVTNDITTLLRQLHRLSPG